MADFLRSGHILHTIIINICLLFGGPSTYDAKIVPTNLKYTELEQSIDGAWQ